MSSLSAKLPATAVPRKTAQGSGIASRVGAWIWRTLEDIGHARARPILRDLADRYAHQPELAQAFREAARQSRREAGR